MRGALLLSTALISITSYSAGANVRGTVYDIEEPGLKLLFQFEKKVSETGAHRETLGRYLTPEGQEAVIEEAKYENGTLRTYEIRQLQNQKQGRAEVRGGRIHFRWEEEGKVKTGEEEYTPNVLIGDQLPVFIRSQWDKIMSGEDVKIRYVVVSRQETVGFKLSKMKEITYKGKSAIVFRMKPSSPIISLLVNPVFLTFEKDGIRNMVETEGRLPPKKWKKGKWDELDGKLALEYAP